MAQHDITVHPESNLELMNRFQEPEMRDLLLSLPIPKGSSGIDVGCGIGFYALWLADTVGADGRVLAIDPSADHIAESRQRMSATPIGERVTLLQGSGTSIEADDQSADWVWCSDVLHHIDDAVAALQEFTRVLRPGGNIFVKESQVLRALLLPGHLDLERQLQRADVEFQKQESGQCSYQERRQLTYETMRSAGLHDISVQTTLVQRQAPLDEAAKGYLQRGIFDRTWGPRIRPWLDEKDWAQRSRLCEADSPQSILNRPGYYCIYPVTTFIATLPE